MQPKVIECRWLKYFGLWGLTFYPLILINPNVPEEYKAANLAHEMVHWHQQKVWYDKAWVFGLVAWYFLYLFALPFGWNPFRFKWELEACKAEGATLDEVRKWLAWYPYFLFWMDGEGIA